MTKTSLLSQKQISPYQVVSFCTEDFSIVDLLEKEYLLTNTRGGYCSSTTVGCNTRRYHGLLIGTLNPPANRILALSNILEIIISNNQAYDLSTFEFDGNFHPEGFKYIKNFTRDIGVHFDYEVDSIEMIKSIYLARDADMVLIEYDFRKVYRPFEFTLRPFTALRDFHHLQNSEASLRFYESDDCFFINYENDKSLQLLINCPDAALIKDPQWWYNFKYRKDQQRCQGYLEDLWAPCLYKYQINGPSKIVFKAQVGLDCDPAYLKAASAQSMAGRLNNAYEQLIAAAGACTETKKKLVIAADQFICRRGEHATGRATILAGYPWFFDWGRDAFISLPGLLLATGRYQEARSVLTTFASASDEGMIPNRFDDRSDTAHFNSIDASLWFINSAFEYLKITNDQTTFNEKLLPVIQKIICRYKEGTKFEIHTEPDGLITGGDMDTQLTWMDAKCEGITFTPRFGKAVEINALWYNALCKLAEYLNSEKSDQYEKLADKVAQSFSNTFWNNQTGYLNDCVRPDGVPDTSCRCNQILAVSLEYSPLSEAQQKQIVDVVRQKLLTPYGLRTLDPEDSRYREAYCGDQFSRDSSYHQGTVWPYMIGPFIEAYLKVNNFSDQSKADARKFLEPLINHITETGCLGSISEIFDGELPHKHRGCFAQAWSISEVLRAKNLIDL